MSMKVTEKGTKKFTKQEKLAIIKEAGEKGVKVTLAKYDLYPATYYFGKEVVSSWRGWARPSHDQRPTTEDQAVGKRES